MGMRRLGIGVGWVAVLGANAWGQGTHRVSIGPGGVEGNGESLSPSLSEDGRFVAFRSSASNLVAADTNGTPDAFVHDRQTGTTERVSVSSIGAQTGGVGSFFSEPSISAGGRYVAFSGPADNFVPADTNASSDAFLHDRQTGTTVRVSVDSGGMEGNDDSYFASVSSDGRFVQFTSHSSNLVPGDANGFSDIFVRDRQTGATERVSVDSNGAEANGACEFGSISADGRYVAFGSAATNLVPNDTNGYYDMFVHDRSTGTTERVSVHSSGAQGNSVCYPFPSLSADGRHVGFVSHAWNLDEDDTNDQYDIFLRDRQAGTTERVSIGLGGVQADEGSHRFAVSADGRFAAFFSHSGNLVPGDTNGSGDFFVRDRLAGTTKRVSVDSSGGEVSGTGPTFLSIAADGRTVAFSSQGSTFVPGDTNGLEDVFVHEDATGFTTLCDAGSSGVIACPCSNPPSGYGRGCENSSATQGAFLEASGGASLAADTLVFATSGERPTALSIVVQGSASLPSGAAYGQGVRCAGGSLKRLFVKSASGGSITAPDFGAGDPTVSARSLALGDAIQAGQSRWYFVYYRDPVVLGGCPASSTFNSTQTGRVDWSM